MMKMDELMYNTSNSPYGHAEMQQYYGQHVMSMPDGSAAFGQDPFYSSGGLGGHPGYAGNMAAAATGQMPNAHSDLVAMMAAHGSSGAMANSSFEAHQSDLRNHQSHSHHNNNNCDSNSELIAALAETREIIS